MMFTPLLQSAAQGGIQGALAATQQPNAASFTGAVLVSGALAATQQPNVAAITGSTATSSTSGTLVATQGAQALVGMSGAVLVAGAWASTQQANTASITGSNAEQGALTATGKPNTAGWGATVWAPTSLPAGAVVHFDASTITPQTDGTTMGSWVDTLAGYTAAQATSGKIPKYRTSRKGGKASVQFEGGQALTFDGTTGINLKGIIDGGDFTVLIALSDVLSSSIGGVFGSSAGGSAFLMMANGATMGRFDGNVTGHTLPWTTTDFAVMCGTSETATAGSYGGLSIGMDRQYINGTPFKSENAQMPATSAALFAIGDNNGAFSATGKFDVYDIVIFSRHLTPAEVLQATVALCQKNNQPLPWGGVARFDVYDGDSICDGVGVTPATGFPYLISQTRARKLGQWANFGIGSIRATQSTAKLQEVTDYINYLGIPENLSYFEYINGQNANRTSAQLFQDIKDYVSAVRAAMPAARINMGDSTCYGRDVSDRLYASYRGVFNGLMGDPTTGIAPLVDAFTQISADTHIGDGNAFNSVPATIGGDSVHPNTLGHTYLAPLIGGGVTALDTAVTSFGFLAARGAPNVSAMSGGVSISGTLAATQRAGTSSFTGIVSDPGTVAGSLVSTGHAGTAAITGVVSTPAITGILAAIQNAGRAVMTGVVGDSSYTPSESRTFNFVADIRVFDFTDEVTA